MTGRKTFTQIYKREIYGDDNFSFDIADIMADFALLILKDHPSPFTSYKDAADYIEAENARTEEED